MPAEPYMAEIFMSGINFAPRGFALCQGQILPIQQNTALFSLMGITFGGNGTQTFGLPDLRGRVPMNVGQGPGLTAKAWGEMAGTENITLLQSQMPMHNHVLNAVNQAGTASAPTGSYLANTGALDKEYIATGTTVPLNIATIATAGGNQPHNNMPPYLVLTFYIALQGIFPSRD